MANKIVKDSASWASLWVKEVQVAAAGTAEASLPVIGDYFASGAKRGVIGDTPRKGDDGAFYAALDTAALVRFDNVAVAFTDGQAVYRTAGGAFTATASGNTLLGYADRAKSGAAGRLFLQFVPQAS